MKNPYEEMTQEDFDRCLRMVLSGQSANDMLIVPGVYEVLAEYFNNEVLDQWRTEQEMEEESE